MPNPHKNIIMGALLSGSLLIAPLRTYPQDRTDAVVESPVTTPLSNRGPQTDKPGPNEVLNAYHADDSLPPPAEFVTHHKILIRGASISYTAIAGDTYITNFSGDVIGSFFSFSYIQDNPASAQRPVLFVSNGGPGSSSIWLHMGAVGPKRVVLNPTINPSVLPPFQAEANPDCLLDVADIVFIDPVGTGYSRILGKGVPQEFFGVDQDVNSVAQFIERWLDKHDRWNSPKFFMGESYGSFRAAILPAALMGGPNYVGLMRGITLNGIVLLGTALDGGRPEVSDSLRLWRSALELPSEAAAAWYQGKASRNDVSPSISFENSDKFARTVYLAALQKAVAGTLTDAERTAVVQELAAYTGLSIEDIPKDMTISAPLFSSRLLADKGLSVGMYDSRYTLPTAHSGGDPVSDDPAMGQYVPAFIASFHQMLREDLNVQLDRPYYAIQWQGMNHGWDWKHAGAPPGQNAAVDLAVAMRRDAGLKVLVGAGYYDLNSSAAIARHDLEEAGIPADRLTFKLYESGHMLYIGKTGTEFSDDVRALIRSASK
jgi:carboxypeptidase C (cathepsin A)